MKKLLFLLFLASCTTSKVYTAKACNVCLAHHDGILLLPLAWNPNFRVLSVSEKNQLERQILSDLAEKGFTKIRLYDDLDYELLKAGIKDLNDPVQRAKIAAELGYPYLLGLSIGATRAGEGWSYQTAQEAYDLSSNPDMEVSANLRIALIETETGEIVSDHTVMAENSGFSKANKEGGIDYWNFADLSGVIRTGVGKGLDFLVKDCAC